MKGSLIVLAVFLAGVAVGRVGLLADGVITPELTECLLYALILQIGLSLGSGGNLSKIMVGVKVRSLLLPLATVIGTLAFTAVAGLALGRWSLADYMALGSGLGYYSLSSVLIIDIKSGDIGLDAATRLGMLALLVNIIREMTALVGGPWLAKKFARYAPVAAAGVTSMDVTLPMIVRCAGQEMFPVALMHGLVLEICVPLFVTLFAEL